MRYIAILLLGLTASVCVAAEAEPKTSEARPPSTIGMVRIKDAADIYGARDNQLTGLGVVVGLDNTGDQSGDLVLKVMANLATRFGIIVTFNNLKPKNIAVVTVTATLPPFIKKGSKLDVQVSSVGDATSLQGGLLFQCPLQGGDGRVYAVAQGALSVGGFVAKGGNAAGGETLTKNHTLVGRIPNGALVEREVETTIVNDNLVRIILRKGDFTNSERIAAAINARWAGSSKAVDPCTVEFTLPQPEAEAAATTTPISIISELETLRFVPDTAARVIINERTGTIVAGAQVRLLPTVVAHGSLLIKIKVEPQVNMPFSLTQAPPVITHNATVSATEEERRALVLEHQGPTVADLATALNSLKVTPRDIIAIFQALKEAGALCADLIIQ